MDITHLHIENCLTIGRATLELDNRGLLLIQGENLDDSSAKSNGAGKSSIVDALCWCLYGTTARDVTGDDVVNDTAKKDCFVSVSLNDDGTLYKIERFRKHAKHKNQLFAWQLAPNPMDPSIPLHKGTDKETQLVVEKIMGCSLDVFAGSIYSGQEKMPDLPGLTDKFLKLLVEEAAGVEELADAHKIASKEALDADKMVAAAKSVLDSACVQLVNATQALNEAIDQEKLFEDGRKGRARDELAKVPPLQAHITSMEAKLAAYDVPSLTKRKGELEAQLAAVSGEQVELDRLQREETAAARRADVARTNLAHVKAEHDKAVSDLANVEAMVGKPCGECGKGYCEHDIEDVKKLRQADELLAKTKQNNAIQAARTERAAWEAARAALDTHRAGMTDVSAASAELSDLNTTLRSADELAHQIKQYGQDIDDIKASARLRLIEPNSWSPHVAGRRVTGERWEKAVQEAQDAYGAAVLNAELAADAVKVFGPAGVRAHILDTVTPFLNDRTREYLGTLADGNIHATWNTLDTTAKGELREKFNIAVSNDKGGKSFKAQSGGEKRKVRLSTALALQDMVASRATKPINLFMADEIDDALDPPGLERLMSVLDRKAKERGTVLVISHNSLSDWIDNVITVTKNGGMSTVAGASIRTF